ncbi:MmcQ/YjbR family DNA-binding protein [Pelagibacterium sp.]|uniref:MmcQ/YjbR family DNA-binding protein n=1 Tax=Pelagibacterium sp. TaxID=1967288 RepID=UPI003BA845F8
MTTGIFERKIFDDFVATLVGTSLVDQWEAHVAKVGGKVFVLLSADENGAALTFKCSEESFELLTSLDGVGQASYFAKRKWVTAAERAPLSATELEAYVKRSYELVAAGLTRKARQLLGISL